MIGVSPDSVKRHDKFKTKYDLALDLAADEELKTIKAYGVWGEKTMFGRKYMGVVRTTFLIGSDGRIARIWNKVRVTGHAKPGARGGQGAIGLKLTACRIAALLKPTVPASAATRLQP